MRKYLEAANHPPKYVKAEHIRRESALMGESQTYPETYPLHGVTVNFEEFEN
jgi:hypothetical protein